MTVGRTLCATMALATALGMGLAGCSSKTVYRASRQLCVASGGTYSAEAKQCTFAAGATVTARKACQDLAGIYVEEWDRCEFNE
jgi:hypothetical protein